MPKFRYLLKNKNFVFYSIGQSFSQFADRLVQIVLIGFVYKRWPGSTVQLAKIFFFTAIPAFIISPIAGVYIDRWNKKYVMIASDMFRAIMVLTVPIFFIYNQNIVPIYIIIFLIFSSACFFLPARLAIIPELVSKEDILIANSAGSITWILSGIAGFSLGGFLAEWLGIKNSFYLNSAIYSLSAISFLFLVYLSRKNINAVEKISNTLKEKISAKSFIHDFKEGMITVFFDKQIRFVASTFFLLFSMVGALYVVGIVFIQETFNSMTKYIGLYSICIFAGLLTVSYLYGKVGHKLPRAKTILISVIFVGICIDIFTIILSTTKSFFLGGITAFLIGFFVAPIYVTANTIIHESIESRMSGRIFSYIGIIMNLGFLVFMLGSSVLAEYIGKFWILIACGTGFALFGVIGLIAGFDRKLSLSS